MPPINFSRAFKQINILGQQKIIRQKHDKGALLYGLSRLLERASYYGIYSGLGLYLTSDVLNMSWQNVTELLPRIASFLTVSAILGALLGDLLFGNKKAIIIGALLNAAGAFVLCIPSSTALYTGMSMVVLGSGLYGPNLVSNFGKQYLNKSKLLDSAYTLLFLAVNIGTFGGAGVASFLLFKTGSPNFQPAFAFSGILVLLSAIPVLKIKNPSPDPVPAMRIPIKSRLIHIAAVAGLLVLFGAIGKVLELKTIVGHSSVSGFFNLPKSAWSIFNAGFYFIPFILLAIYWTTRYSTHLSKLLAAFVFGALAYAILYISESQTTGNSGIFLFALFLISVSEVFTLPVYYSLLTRYTNPKYLAIFVSLIYVPGILLRYPLNDFRESAQYQFPQVLMIGFVGMIVLGAAVSFYRSTTIKAKYSVNKSASF